LFIIYDNIFYNNIILYNNFKGEIWNYVFQLLYERENITKDTQFSIRAVCKSWLKIFSEILFVEIEITYNSGIKYNGDWKNLKKEGRGQLINKFSKIIYEGEFKII
jgi:hypothetical protein